MFFLKPAQAFQQLAMSDHGLGQFRGADATACFNHGVALEDLGRLADAIAAYERALACDPDYVDAHYNLARLYERLGRQTAAIRHLKAYRQLTR